MSNEDVVCAAFDNTSVNIPGENALQNSNTTSTVSQSLQNPLENGVEENDIEALSQDNLDPGVNVEFEIDLMTGSYGEISLEREVLDFAENSNSHGKKDEALSLPLNYDNECTKEMKRPSSLVLLKNSRVDELGAKPSDPNYKKCVHKGQQTSDSQATSVDGSPSFSSEEFALHSSGHQRTGSDTSGLSDLQGTLTVDGDMVTFVAEDLQEKIKMSSPVSKWADSSLPGSQTSTPSLYRQALRSQIPAIDPNALIDLECSAKKVATCVDTMLENLSGTLQSISSLTVDCMETYEQSVCKTCDAVDMNIKAVYQLMAKCEELVNSMGPLYKISEDLKNIKRVLDQLEHMEHRS